MPPKPMRASAGPAEATARPLSVAAANPAARVFLIDVGKLMCASIQAGGSSPRVIGCSERPEWGLTSVAPRRPRVQNSVIRTVDGDLFFNPRPALREQALLRQEAPFVVHLARALDPVAEIQIAQ